MANVFGSHGEFIHPSVSSRVIDNTEVLIVSTGATKLLAAFASEKGPDRVAVNITSPEEFVFTYGQPDIKKYGQTAYNVMEWVRNAGEAICIRVTGDGRPVDDVDTEPAYYAGSIFTVTSKRNTASSISATPPIDVGTKQVVAFDFTGTMVAGGVTGQNHVPATPQVTNLKVTNGSDNDGRTYIVRIHPEGNISDGVIVVVEPGEDEESVADEIVAAINNGSTIYEAEKPVGIDDEVTITNKVPGPQPQVMFTDSPYGSGITVTLTRTPGQREVPEIDQVDPSVIVNGIPVTLAVNDDAEDVATKIAAAFAADTDYTVDASNTLVVFTSNVTGIQPDVTIRIGEYTSGVARSATVQKGINPTPDPSALRSEWVTEAFTPVHGGDEIVLSNGDLFTDNLFETVDLSRSYTTPTSTAIELSQIVNDLTMFNSAVPDVGIDYNHHLFAVVPFGRGAWYNNIGYKLTPNFDYVDSYDFALFDFEVFEKYRGGDISREKFTVSLSPDAVGSGGESLFIEEIVKTYSQYVRVVFNETAYNFLGDVTGVNPDRLDVVTWRPLTPVTATWTYGGISRSRVLDEIEATGVMTNYEQQAPDIKYLENGSDGDTLVRGLQDLLLVSAYRGETDPIITDEIMIDVDVLLDANYTGSIKRAMADFAATRRDCVAILDTNHLGSAVEAVNYRKSVIDGVNTPYASIFTQAFTVRDDYHSRDIDVTSTYFLSQKIPLHDSTIGIHQNFVGPRRGIVSGFKDVNFIPGPAQKDLLYKAQVNYLEADRDFFNWGSQSTSFRSTSVLSNLSVVRMLGRMERETKMIARQFRFEFFNKETYSVLQKNIYDTLYKYQANGGVSEFSVQVYASDYDRAQKILRVKIPIIFTDIIERIFIDFVIDR